MKRYAKRAIPVVFLLFLLWIGIGFYISRYSLQFTEYQIHSPKITSPIRIVQIADLHSTDFGGELCQMIASQSPDLIVIVGDLVEQSNEDIAAALHTLRTLADIAPVYVSMGNHEKGYESNYNIDLVKTYSESGAIVLDSQYQDLEINGQTIRLGGIYGYCLPDNVEEAQKSENGFLHGFQNTPRFTLLLSHMPVCWLINGSLEYWDVDCVLSGHSHGGQVVLPFIGGMYAPDQGWFPDPIDGHFETDNKHLIVTTGLGGTTPIPRFYNRPEIVILDILPVV